MATIGPRDTVPAPRPQVWRPNLIRAARAAGTYIETPVPDGAASRVATEGNTLDRWGAGIAYRPELAFTRPDPDAEGEVVDGPGEYIDCPEGDEVDQADKSVVAGNAVVQWDPYVLYDGDTCTTMGSAYAESSRRATESLARQTSHLLENVLWTGVVNGEDFTVNHPNTALASADAELPNGSTALGVVPALALMVEALSDFLGGEQGMIHVPAYLIPYLSFYGQITRVGDTNMLFAGDHLVVTGTGYTGSGPNSPTTPGGIVEEGAWIYGTSFVEVRVSGVFPIPTESQVYVDLAVNSITVIAERLALAHWDRTAHVGINVCIPDPGPACTTSS